MSVSTAARRVVTTTNHRETDTAGYGGVSRGSLAGGGGRFGEGDTSQGESGRGGEVRRGGSGPGGTGRSAEAAQAQEEVTDWAICAMQGLHDVWNHYLGVAPCSTRSQLWKL